MAHIKPVPVASRAANENASARGPITSPYFDLDSSVRVADVIYSKGGGSCTADQLALWLNYTSTRSGTFLTRVSAANKHFGLIAQDGDRFIVTERAKKILSPVMPDDAVDAKADAFLAVPLFAKVFEDFRGNQLPPEIGLKNLFLNTYKLLPDRATHAVRIFMNSAAQSGLLATTGDRSRLVRPGAAPGGSVSPAVAAKIEETPPFIERLRAGGGGSGGDGPPGVHSAITGLLRELPAPGTPWSAQKKQRFLDAFKSTIEFLYPEEDSP